MNHGLFEKFFKFWNTCVQVRNHRISGICKQQRYYSVDLPRFKQLGQALPYTLLILINGNYICNWQLFTLEGILNGFRTIKYMTKLGPLCLVYLTCSDSIRITSWVQSASFSVPLGTQAKIQIKMNYLTDLAHSVHRE